MATLDHFLPKAKVLITVKTYPLPSRKYDELVCTAGLLEGKHWIRIYPVPYRELTEDQQFKKWDWIELDLERRRDDDPREESYQPRRGVNEPITILGSLDVSPKHLWSFKRQLLLKDVCTSMEPLIVRAKTERISLAVVKPKSVLDVNIEKEPEHWDEFKHQGLLDLIPATDRKRTVKPVRSLPYRFSYVFTTEDGRPPRTLMVEDWEIGVLYWHCLRPDRTPEEACALVKRKLESLAFDKDIHFIVGTTKRNHFRSPNPFVIIGLFYPPFAETFGQGELFE